MSKANEKAVQSQEVVAATETEVKISKKDISIENLQNDVVKGGTESFLMIDPKIAQEIFKSKVKEVEVTAEYINLDEWEKGEERKYILTGVTKIKTSNEDSEAEEVPAVKLYGEDGKNYITAAAVMVSSMQGFPLGTAFSVAFLGLQKAKTGKYAKMRVNLLS